MLKKFLRKLIGVDKLEEQLNELKQNAAFQTGSRSELESKVIQSEKAQELIREDVAQAQLSDETRSFMNSLDIKITKDSKKAAIMAMEAGELVQRYDFRRFVPPAEDQYPKRVISLKELQEHPEKYIHKLSKGIMNFPVGLNFDAVNKILRDLYLNCQIATSTPFSNNGTFDFVLSAITGNYTRDDESSLLAKTMKLSNLNRIECNDWVHIDTMDFMANYPGLESYIIDRPGLTQTEKERAISALRLARLTYVTAAELIGKTRIRDTAELLDYTNPFSSAVQDGNCEIVPADMHSGQLHTKIRESLISEPGNTSSREIDKLLPIRSKERFRELASMRTGEIISNDKNRRGLTTRIAKPIEEYTIGESLVLACYFARNVITKYETLEDAVKNIFEGNVDNAVSGKCTDYTGLALQYLREYLVPLYPEKFQGWKFGYDNQVIGDYRHCYIKAIHINEDKSIDVYFLDPTLLADKGIAALKTPEKVLEYMKTSNHPLQIERDAEDLITKPIKNEGEADDPEDI